MGDVGSLSLGGALGVVAVLIKQEILLVFLGGVYVIEAHSTSPRWQSGDCSEPQ